MTNCKKKQSPSSFRPSSMYRDYTMTFPFKWKIAHLLKRDLKIMEMKQIHIMTFCPTIMLGILSASPQGLKVIVPICDFLTSAYIKRRNRINLCFPKE